MCYFALCVTNAGETAPEKSEMSVAARVGWIVLICATLYVCYFSHLGAIGFVGPDEPRYAWIARAMVETGDWVTPRLYDKPWFEKPPLYYWGAAICFKLFGVNEASARLPSAVSALLATLAMAWLAWRIYGRETARWVLLLLPTTVGMIGFSHAAATDMPFSGMLSIATVCAAAVVGLADSWTDLGQAQHAAPLQREPGTPWAATLLFGFFLGLAVLAKGPAGIILCGGGVFFWALFTKRWRDVLRLLHPAGILTFCATALPWYILCTRRNPDFFRIFIIEHNFKRYLTPEFQHIQPFWFYVPVLLVGLLPWTFAFVSRRPNNDSPSRSTLWFLCFSGFVFLFFSASQSKLPGYILPALPSLGVLVSRSIVLSCARRRVLPGYVIGATSLALSAFLFRCSARHVFSADILPASWTRNVWLPLVAAGVGAIVLSALRRPRASICAVQLGMLLSTLGLLAGLHWVDAQYSARGVLAANAMSSQPASSAVFVHDVPRGIQFGLNFYLHRELPIWQKGDNGLVFTSSKGQAELMQEGFVCVRRVTFAAALLCRNAVDSAAAPGGKAQ